MKNILESLYHLMLFRTYTTMSRTIEILYGIAAWGNVSIILYTIINL